MGFNRRICLQIAVASTLRAHSHYLRLSTDLSDSAWGAHEMHCGSVRPFGSVACVKKLRNVQLYRQRRIRRPIRSRLCKYTPRVSWIHFAIKEQEEAGYRICRLYFFKEMWNDGIVFSHLLFVSSFVFLATHRLCCRKRFDWLQCASD